jgi:hypothetical protein
MAGSLEFIKSASGSSVSTLDVDNCFSDKYDVYKILISKLDLSANASLYIKYKNSSGLVTTSTYDYALLNLKNYSGFTETRVTSTTFLYTAFAYSPTSNAVGYQCYIFNPYDSSSYTFAQGQSSAFLNGFGSYGTKWIGVEKTAQQIVGIQFLPSTGSFDNLEVSVYGVK